MTKEVSLLKKALKYAFPTKRISVRMRRTKNYADSSDKIIINVSNTSYKDVKNILQNCTKNIKISHVGEFSYYFSEGEPCILDISCGNWHSADMCEFIEIQNGAE